MFSICLFCVRWGRDILCKHGDFYTCTDRYNPGVLQKHKWENAMTIDRYFRLINPILMEVHENMIVKDS